MSEPSQNPYTKREAYMWIVGSFGLLGLTIYGLVEWPGVMKWAPAAVPISFILLNRHFRSRKKSDTTF